jgi:alpha(1,3/1,4) fucosyltransferase
MKGGHNLIYIDYVEDGVCKNDRFRLDSDLNRDDSNYPFFLLREKLLSHNISLNTPDLNSQDNPGFELHMNIPRKPSKKQKFLLLLETPEVYEPNSNLTEILRYQHVFTWRQDLKCKHQSHINFPNTLQDLDFRVWSERDSFACLIASGSKGMVLDGDYNLYKKRIETIKWFENFAPNEFNLYGPGWESSIVPRNRWEKLLRKASIYAFKFWGYQPYISYRGKVATKAEVLHKHKFNICYENTSRWPGYITEKIFDSFFSGCIPVYWGAPDVSMHIPEACFVDRRKFSTHQDLYEYMKSITSTQFLEYQQAILSFLNSEKAKAFYAEKFAETVSAVISDFIYAPDKNLKLT